MVDGNNLGGVEGEGRQSAFSREEIEGIEVVVFSDCEDEVSLWGDGNSDERGRRRASIGGQCRRGLRRF